ncbi:MAG TPA: MliC family protein [Allosphingosinicella sp.]|nr:MliC family protein [Allosphingosinicella sp.]
MLGLRTVLLAALLLAGCAGHHVEPGPAGIPYLCADGGTARITYEGGGYFPRAHARLSYRGREIALAAVPPTYGLRYVSESEPILIWSARGEEAWLSELGPDGGTERELAHCTRVR